MGMVACPNRRWRLAASDMGIQVKDAGGGKEMTIGEKLRELRIAKGIPAAALDERFDIQRGISIQNDRWDAKCLKNMI